MAMLSRCCGTVVVLCGIALAALLQCCCGAAAAMLRRCCKAWHCRNGVACFDKPANRVLVHGVLEKPNCIRFWGGSKGPKNRFFVCRINFGGSHDNKRQFSDLLVGLNLPGGEFWGG